MVQLVPQRCGAQGCSTLRRAGPAAAAWRAGAPLAILRCVVLTAVSQWPDLLWGKQLARRRHHNQRKWTVVETRSASSGDFIRDASCLFTVYHPKYRAPRVAGVRRVLALFPGYTFVETTASRFNDLHRLDDVRKVFPLGCVERDFIEHLQDMEDDLGYVDEMRLMNWRAAPNLLPGEMVRGLYGLFGGQVGQFVDYDEDGYARVMFKILGGRELEAHVDAHELSTLWELHGV